MAETKALEDLRVLGLAEPEQYLDPKALLGFGTSVAGFNAALERQVVDHGWYAEAPRITRNRWLGRAVLEIGAGLLLFLPAFLLPSDGLTLVALAAIAAGIVTFVVAFSMPAKTMAGAMIQAMLAGYRRTLAATMATARSMNQVVAEAKLPWLRTPDLAMVWATAVGLQDDIDLVLQRSLTDVESKAASADATYFPSWYTPAFAFGSTGGGSGAWGAHGASQGSGGIFSSSAVPELRGHAGRPRHDRQPADEQRFELRRKQLQFGRQLRRRQFGRGWRWRRRRVLRHDLGSTGRRARTRFRGRRAVAR